MKKSKQIIVLSSLLVLCVFLLGVQYYGKLPNFICENTLLESAVSPDRQKVAIVYVQNCGATTGWLTQLVLLDNNLLSKSVASVISNGGQATPKSIEGWAIIKPVWDEDNLVVYHSKDAYIEGQNKVDDVEINYSELDQLIIEKYHIEIK